MDFNGKEYYSNIVELKRDNTFEGEEVVTVYPNPSKGSFSLEINNLIVNSQAIVRVVNLHGQEVYKSYIQPIKTDRFIKQIDLAQQAVGMYTIQIITENGFVNKKIIIKR